MCSECDHEFQAERYTRMRTQCPDRRRLCHSHSGSQGEGRILVHQERHKAKNIRLVEPEDGIHEIFCKIPGFGSMMLKTSVVMRGL